MSKFTTDLSNYISSIPSQLKYLAKDFLVYSNLIDRQIGSTSAYDELTQWINTLGRMPESILSKNYYFASSYIDELYENGTGNTAFYNGELCNRFTFYKETDVPTLHLADVEKDPEYLIDRWFPSMSFGTTIVNNMQLSYAESNQKDVSSDNTVLGEDVSTVGMAHGYMESMQMHDDVCDLLGKTNRMFKNGKYDTLIARFHTSSVDETHESPIQTAISKQYGMSHGRNLLKKSPSTVNGYDNPYCRVWTYHHQYNQLSRAIRPFGSSYDTQVKIEKGMAKCGDFVTFRTQENEDYGVKGGSQRLDDYGVLNYDNGMVRIAPTAKLQDYFDEKLDGKSSGKNYSVKKCMFSIENLAWKANNIDHYEYDTYGLSPEQKGPFGGRIMWFPPYNLKFSEDTSVNWNANQFIGRGENVYTYTNSERSGQLSFTLLIDHPAILDYWTGRDENGKKNNCQGLDSDNDNGVDDVNYSGAEASQNQEQAILRFFAGCVNDGSEKEGDESGGSCGDILTAKQQRWQKRQARKQEVEKPKEVKVEQAAKPTPKIIHCVLYFPNNYSGADDAPLQTATVNSVDYLMRGIGTQKYIDPNTKEAVDWGLSPTTSYLVTVNGKSINPCSGYEIENPVSLTTCALTANYDTIKKTYADLVSNERKGQYLTDENANIVSATSYDSPATTVSLAKIVDSKALSLASAKEKTKLTSAPHEWYRRRWYYRVDSAYADDRLSNIDSYLDTQCKGLNCSKGYQILNEYSSVAKTFGIDASGETETLLVSFADLYYALNGNTVERITNSGNMATIQEVLGKTSNSQKRYTLTSIQFQGHASRAGYKTSNNTLAKKRADTFKAWLNSFGLSLPSKQEVSVINQTENPKYDIGENSTVPTKLWRSASMIIEYTEEDVVSASTNDNTAEVSTEVDNKETSKTITNPYELSKENMAKMDSLSPYIREMQQQGLLDSNANYTDPSKVDFDNSILGLSGITTGYVDRYDNEGEFFEELKVNSPFMHHLIKDKIKYFDPAFHSISPEGFNARLTFLNQCTRQGSTSDNGSQSFSSTAYNLAFGRPPVCILRVGDFYYTKIIINNLSIQYDDVQWDLNPEGIGVMPMFANVSISFKFLGGSDLSGPIARLQNAVSFNYYANTGVYDNRAEMVEYESDGSGKETKFKPYMYPDMVYNNGSLPRKLQASVTVEPLQGTMPNTNTEFTQGETTTVNKGTYQAKTNGKQIQNQILVDKVKEYQKEKELDERAELIRRVDRNMELIKLGILK